MDIKSKTKRVNWEMIGVFTAILALILTQLDPLPNYFKGSEIQVTPEPKIGFINNFGQIGLYQSTNFENIGRQVGVVEKIEGFLHQKSSNTCISLENTFVVKPNSDNSSLNIPINTFPIGADESFTGQVYFSIHLNQNIKNRLEDIYSCYFDCRKQHLETSLKEKKRKKRSSQKQISTAGEWTSEAPFPSSTFDSLFLEYGQCMDDALDRFHSGAYNLLIVYWIKGKGTPIKKCYELQISNFDIYQLKSSYLFSNEFFPQVPRELTCPGCNPIKAKVIDDPSIVESVFNTCNISK